MQRRLGSGIARKASFFRQQKKVLLLPRLNRVIILFRPNLGKKSTFFGIRLGRVLGVLSECFLVAFGILLGLFREPFWSPLEALGPPLAALGIVYETFVWL